MNNKVQVGLLFGGNSSEYEVSIMSVQNVYDAIDKSKFDVHPIWVTTDGYIANEDDSYAVLENPKHKAKSRLEKANLTNVYQLSNLPEIDVFFPIIHGNLGEDGCLQGLFRILNKPFVGDDVLAAAVTMDKEFSKILARHIGVPVANWISIKRKEYNNKDSEKLNYAKVAARLGGDLFVKPSNQGSSVGIHHVVNAHEFNEALRDAFKYDDKVLVEEAIHGTEIETAILGNDDPIVSGVGQILNAEGTFYSYENKYGENSTSILQVPAELPRSTIEEARSIALKVYQITESSGLSRVDSILRETDKKVIFTEINALPGFTNISMYPRLFEQIGISYSELITKLIENAVDRFNHKQTLLHKK
ncbi:D-alanine--D-alanine ligase family protein [Lactobacillus sp. B4026]|uniref:D-alanine--D-alanine ligase family protein n=1 Tax=Lactobacillus sp. B4026 TaxID=2818035 RepID=UPI00226B99E3|nr:D-alanine--D-alanine ligase family protein [Lactobacillus sp. B4026]MCX8737307.1 D-alanine--D-alanine ligase [Lactobacillus sp. B4026]